MTYLFQWHLGYSIPCWLPLVSKYFFVILLPWIPSLISFFLTETTPNKTPNKTPQLPPPSQIVIKGTADGLKQELGRLSQNEALIRNAITVLQNTMHELTKTENKLNVTLTTQKRRLDNLFSTVSFSFLFVEDISFAWQYWNGPLRSKWNELVVRFKRTPDLFQTSCSRNHL